METFSFAALNRYIIHEVAYLAMNKGGTMESLFHPYVEGLLLRAEE